ncbi:MAG: 50S ribosomal protein L3 [Chlamydiia bacterium]|nr:50S ribosomal protein L3 [Chlamydiia bacterium]
MALKLMGKKWGMTQRFDKSGNVVVCSVIHAEPNVITQIKSKESDGYNAIQMGYEKIVTKDPRTIEKRVAKPLLGHFKKQGVEPRRHLAESRIDEIGDYVIGQELTVSLFEKVAYVDITGISKGKGYQGVMKRYNFRGGPAAHGSGFHRHGGSTGMRSTPGEVFKGTKKAGCMGGVQVTVENLKIIGIDKERNLILVEGAIPGPKGGVVSLSPAIKRMKRS